MERIILIALSGIVIGALSALLITVVTRLVAEAKPEEYEDYYATNPVEKGRKMGYNEATREFERNILKALEEV